MWPAATTAIVFAPIGPRVVSTPETAPDGVAADGGHLAVLDDVDAPRRGRAGEAPGDSVVPRRAAAPLQRRADDGIADVGRNVEDRAERLRLHRRQPLAVDAGEAVGVDVALDDLDVVDVVGEHHHPAGGVHDIVVQLARQALPQFQGMLVERGRFFPQVVRAQDRGVASGIAAAEPALLQHGDPAHPVILGEIIGGREPVSARPDDDDVIRGFGSGLRHCSGQPSFRDSPCRTTLRTEKRTALQVPPHNRGEVCAFRSAIARTNLRHRRISSGLAVAEPARLDYERDGWKRVRRSVAAEWAAIVAPAAVVLSPFSLGERLGARHAWSHVMAGSPGVMANEPCSIGVSPCPSEGRNCPAVSIIVPHYNDLENLERCVAMIVIQTVPRSQYEIVVADNNSRCGVDEVRRVCGEAARVIAAPIQGAGPARNAGVAASRGETLAFIDFDCRPAPDWLERGLAALATAELVGGQVEIECADPSESDRRRSFRAGLCLQRQALHRAGGVYRHGQHVRSAGDIRSRRRLPGERLRGRRLGPSRDRRRVPLELSVRRPCLPSGPARLERTHRKWRRLTREAYAGAREHPYGRARFVIFSCLILGSPFVHWVVVAKSPKLVGVAQRLGAIGVLFAIRFWRFLECNRLMIADFEATGRAPKARPPGKADARRPLPNAPIGQTAPGGRGGFAPSDWRGGSPNPFAAHSGSTSFKADIAAVARAF